MLCMKNRGTGFLCRHHPKDPEWMKQTEGHVVVTLADLVQPTNFTEIHPIYSNIIRQGSSTILTNQMRVIRGSASVVDIYRRVQQGDVLGHVLFVVFNLAGLQPQAPIQNRKCSQPVRRLAFAMFVLGCCHDFVQSHSDESIRFCFTTPVDVLWRSRFPQRLTSKLLEYAGDPRQRIQKFDRNHSSIVCPSTPVNA